MREDISAVRLECSKAVRSVFKEYIMLQVKLQGLQFLHVGLVYRNRQDIQDQLSTSNLCDLFQEAVEMQATRLVIVGDFNLREIDWNRGISLESPNPLFTAVSSLHSRKLLAPTCDSSNQIQTRRYSKFT